jgi:hypothetical protein
MPKRILVKAPGRVVVAGRQYQFSNDEVGRTLLLPDHEASAILEGASKHNFTLIGEEADAKPTSIHQLSVTAVVRPTKKPQSITKHSDWATPYAQGTNPDPIYFEEKVAKEEPAAAPVKEEEPPKEPEVIKEEPKVEESDEPLVTTKLEEEEVSPLSNIKLDPKAHWSKVKAILAEVEGSEPIDFDLVRRIKETYPSYEAIQRDCDELLELE